MSDPSRKVVVCIPQTIIAKGFVNRKELTLPGGTVLDWRVRQNFCDPLPGKVAALRRFMLSPAAGDLESRVVVTTHKGLAAAFQGFSADKKVAAIRKTTFIFDEAHHIQAGDQVANQLGSVLTFVMQANDPTVRLLLATAFFFRGDRLPILDDEQAARFLRHTVAFDEYWGTLTHLSSYRYDFVMFAGSVWGELEIVLAASQEPTIIYCPPEGHRLLLGSTKAEFAGRVAALVQKHYDARLWMPDSDPRKKVVLDLVDASHREEKVRFAMTHGDRIAAILTVGMFREGADWEQAQRVIDLMPTGSDQDRNQRFGRLLRDYPGKAGVSYLSFFPRLPDVGEEERRRHLSRLYAHFHASLVLENALVPIRVPTEPKPPRSDEGGRRGRVNLLGNFDEQMQEDIIGDCHDALVKLASEAESRGGSVAPEAAFREIAAVLACHDIRDDVETLAKQIVLILRRRANLALPVEDLVEAGFDKVWASDALEGLRLYSAGVGGPDTFRAIRRAAYTVFDLRWTEMYTQIRELPSPPRSSSRAKWWVGYNRQLRMEEKLSPERVKLLERIPWWTWREGYEDRFDRQYEEINRLECCPSPSDPLYVFVSAMRQRYRIGKLSGDRIARLEAIPWWQWRTRNSFEDLCREAASLGAEPGDGSRLYQWSWRTRQRYAKGQLTPDQIKMVEAIPWWSWRRALDTTWQRNYEAVAALPEPPLHGQNPKEYKFVHAQRARYKSGKLAPEQVARFEAISWWTW